MATLRDRLNALLRYRVGKYDSQTLANDLGIYGTTVSGSNINENTALTISTVYACVYKIASTLASLDLEVYERTGVTSLICLDIYDVDRKTVNGQIVYSVRNVGIVQPENMLEICNLQRKSPIRLHRENLGLAKAAEDFGAEYFGSGGQMTGILSSDQPLKKEQMDIIQGSWNKAAQQAGTKLLPFGFKYSRISISPDEAQFIETRKFQAEEICRIFSVPPTLVQLESQTTYNNVEQQNLQFARHTIAPWAKRIEQEIDRKLIQSRERPQIYSKFNLNDLYRGDMQSRADFYTKMLNNGVLSINEVRGKEELNPTDGGDTHTVAVNQIALDRLGAYSDKVSETNNNGQ